MSQPLAPQSALGAARSRRRQLARASLWTGTGTLLSRITGLVRLVVLAYALGGQRLADAFNLANNTPNIVHDLVLGGVLAATFVPVFVDRLVRANRAEAQESISAVVSLAGVVLLVATALFVAFAPQIIDLYTLGATSAHEHAVAVDLLRFFAPQLACYGAISLASAVLATEDRFALVGFVPIINNLVGIVVLLVFASFTHGSNDLLARVFGDQGLMVLLGLGTTIGVALQALALALAMGRLNLRLRFVWRPRDIAVRSIVSLSGWTFGFVVANQVAVFVVLALAFHVGHGAVSAYTYAFTFFQLPFGVIAVSVMNVATPDLARAHALGRALDIGARVGVAIRQILALIVPATAGYLILAKPIIALLLQHGQEHAAQANVTASTLAMFALGLPGFCLYFLIVRTFQAMQDTRTAFYLYVLENGTNIVFALLLYHRLGAKGLALAYSIAYSLGALAGLATLHERLGTLGGRTLVRAVGRAVVLSVVMAVVVAFVSALTGTSVGVLGWAKLVIALSAGLVAYLGGAGIVASLSRSRRTRRDERTSTPTGAHASYQGHHRQRE